MRPSASMSTIGTFRTTVAALRPPTPSSRRCRHHLHLPCTLRLVKVRRLQRRSGGCRTGIATRSRGTTSCRTHRACRPALQVRSLESERHSALARGRQRLRRPVVVYRWSKRRPARLWRPWSSAIAIPTSQKRRRRHRAVELRRLVLRRSRYPKRRQLRFGPWPPGGGQAALLLKPPRCVRPCRPSGRTRRVPSRWLRSTPVGATKERKKTACRKLLESSASRRRHVERQCRSSPIIKHSPSAFIAAAAPPPAQAFRTSWNRPVLL